MIRPYFSGPLFLWCLGALVAIYKFFTGNGVDGDF